MHRIKNRIACVKDMEWDRIFLENSLSINAAVVFVGSSYTLYGIDIKSDSTVLALPSQDIYYSLKLINNYISEHNIPHRIVLGLGYYALYHDLSSVKSYDENVRIRDVYYPVVRDAHNLNLSDVREKYGWFNKLMQYYVRWQIKSKGIYDYFSNRGRELRARKTWKDVNKKWSELTPDEKMEAANERVRGHELFFRHKNTLNENVLLLRRMFELSRMMNVELFIFIAPMSLCYLEAMSKEYRKKKDELHDIAINFSDKFIDFNDKEYTFFDEDFVDADHLSKLGAKKLGKYLKDEGFY